MLIPSKLDSRLRIPSTTESGIFQDQLGRIHTKTKDVEPPNQVRYGCLRIGYIRSVFHKPRLVLAKRSSQLHNESEGHEEIALDCQMN